MNLQTFLDKFTNDRFVITVPEWCEELPFCEYSEEKKKDYWLKFKDREVKNFCILTTNDTPELFISLW